MVQFGVYLESFRNPEWATYYLSYENLKVLIYALQKASKRGEQGLKQSDLPEGQAFEKCLDDNLKKIDGFFISKKTELEERFQSLKKIIENGISNLQESEKENLRKQFHQIYVELNLLRDFSNLNYTGFSKILKKHDKIVPEFKMKKVYFKEYIHQKAVFGNLDPLYSILTQLQSLYSEAFEDFNRIDTEISFGEALAKATEDIARSSNQERRKATLKANGFRTGSFDLTLTEGNIAVPEFVVSPQKRKERNFLQNVLFQRARLTVMAANYFSSQKDSAFRAIIAAVLLILIGGCGQSIFLEFMVRIDPASGPTITFFQFLFIALQGLSDFVVVKPPVDSEGNDIPLTSKWQKLRHLRMKELKIPILYHAGCVIMSWLSAIFSSQAYQYNISVPFHMVFKGSILLVNMLIGSIVLRKRYKMSQVVSIIILSLGIMFSTFASIPKNAAQNNEDSDEGFWSWMIGILLLSSSLLLTGFLGILQDLSYKKFGQHWQEALFYSHFLGLPLFLSMSPEIYSHIKLWIFDHQIMLLFLVLNILTTYIGVNSIYKLMALTSSLTSNLTITIRKFISLFISVYYFKTSFTLIHWFGAILVLFGTVLYTQASQTAQKKEGKQKKN